MTTPTWRLLVTPDREPAWNMALDEALLLDPDAAPTVRFYTWKPACISLGYFQDARVVEPLPAGTALVRRITGGLAIHHYAELTWSITAAESTFAGPIEGSYRRLHQALIEAIHSLGAREVHIREEERLLSEGPPNTPWCFLHSSHLDLVWEGRKLAGSAQRRTGGRLLHHGSVPLEANPVTPETAWVGQAVGRTVPFPELAEAFGVALGRVLGVRLEPGALTAAEEEAAAVLVREKHAHTGHLHRRPRGGHPPAGCGIDDSH